ncbi:MAG TPA: zinc-dependent alcohol dehydrogenase family protein [archaeon]|nr:zinc-dependent alcohol dehydrogenase family protein [archaeon]
MRAFVVKKPFQARVEEVRFPEPGPDEVTIQVERVGVCGTDFHIFKGEYIGRYPLIPGHEFSGTIERLGDRVTGFKPGDRVTVDPSLFCGRCRFCLTGRTNQCESFGAVGVTVPGALAEYVAVPVEKVFRLPDSLSFAEGAFVEPVACVVFGMRRLQLEFGGRVLVFGAGSIGQLLTQAIAHAGASELVVVDLEESKLALAEKFGATKTVLSKDAGRELGQAFYPYGFDVVVDATGVPEVIQQAFKYLGPAGKYLQFGVAPKEAEIRISPFDLYRQDWTLIGSMAINQTFLPALNWLREKRVDVVPLISETIELEQLAEFLARPKEKSLLKVQVKLR